MGKKRCIIIELYVELYQTLSKCVWRDINKHNNTIVENRSLKILKRQLQNDTKFVNTVNNP